MILRFEVNVLVWSMFFFFFFKVNAAHRDCGCSKGVEVLVWFVVPQ